MLKLFGLYLLLVNGLTFLVYRLDKRRAERGGRRIPERELLLWALAGGTPAAFLAMRRFRHKTKKTSFRVGLFGVLAVQAVLVWLSVRG